MAECGDVRVPCKSLLSRPPSSGLRGEEALDAEASSHLATLRMTPQAQHVALGDVAAITLRPEREGGTFSGTRAGTGSGRETQATPLANQRGSSHTRPPPPPASSSIISLKLQDSGEVGLRGISTAGPASLSDGLHSGWRRQTSEAALNGEEGPLSPLERYLASRRHPVSGLRPTQPPHPVEVVPCETLDKRPAELASSRLCRHNKYFALMHKGMEKDACDAPRGVYGNEVDGSTLAILAGIGSVGAPGENAPAPREERVAVEAADENEPIFPPLTYPDPSHPGILHRLCDARQMTCIAGTHPSGGNSGCSEDATVVVGGGAAAAAEEKEGGSGRREAYLLKKLQEKSCDLERARAELRRSQESVERETEQRIQQEELILGNFRHLTSAQRALLDFDALLRPAVRLEDLDHCGRENPIDSSLPTKRRLSFTFIHQLRERSVTPGDRMAQQDTTVSSATGAEPLPARERAPTARCPEEKVDSRPPSPGLEPAAPCTLRLPSAGEDTLEEPTARPPPLTSGSRGGHVAHAQPPPTAPSPTRPPASGVAVPQTSAGAPPPPPPPPPRKLPPPPP
ncbi:uncharacterized protein Tco025E_05628 [Trypanosoma conorhini]|uniref:Uncharacterized protein n=1 Tax=Trypanosoma conorhini TaxID=83891 RepID=A0A3R7P0D5_9TRYP|nr:uncharacterized protein Tco025E_05628 [Trypanosoma conorhini]RNF15062.1 hypothetical protein Tco025E_05628 [Trypanosoma conorhini]